MTYSLPTELVSFVESAVAAGDYDSPEAVVAAGLRLLQERRKHDDYVRRELQIGIDQLNRGDFISLESLNEVEAYVQDKLQASLNRADSQRNSA